MGERTDTIKEKLLVEQMRGALHDGGRWLVIATIVCAVSLCTLAAFRVYDWLDTAPPPYAPLTFPGGNQHVLTPVIHNGDGVEVSGTRCSKATEPITVNGSFAWVSFTPSGIKSDVFAGAAMRKPGCERVRFLNPMPTQVVAANTALFASGARQIQWRLEGAAVPTDPDTLELGVPATWRSEVFTVVP